MKKIKVAFISLVVITLLLTSGCVSSEVRTIRNDIYTLDRGNTVSGSFVLGTGTIDGEPSYEYYIVLPNGGYKLKSVRASVCTLFQNETGTPYITANYRGRATMDNTDSQVGDIGDLYMSLPIAVSKYRPTEYGWFKLDSEVEIHIPPNSITKQYRP